MAKHMEEIKNLKELMEEIPEGTPILPDGLNQDDAERRRVGMI